MIIIAPCSRPLLNGKRNPKDYPYWKEVCSALEGKGIELVQIGRAGDVQYTKDFRTLSLKEVEELISKCDTYITIDSFVQHLGWYAGKRGIVIFSVSDPLLFGHKENFNIVDRQFLRRNQFDIYENELYNEKAFPSPEKVVESVFQ